MSHREDFLEILATLNERYTAADATLDKLIHTETIPVPLRLQFNEIQCTITQQANVIRQLSEWSMEVEDRLNDYIATLEQL